MNVIELLTKDFFWITFPLVLVLISYVTFKVNKKWK